jgi:hypothetical protein
MWFIFIAACLFIGGLLIPGSRDPQYGHRDALVNSLIASGGTYTRVAPASLAHTTPSSATAERGALAAERRQGQDGRRRRDRPPQPA